MGEQGAESLHAQMMGLGSTYRNIPNELSRLQYIMAERSIATDPSLLALRPPTKKRKKTEDEEEEA